MLLCRILDGTPALRGALCRGRGNLFSGERQADTDTAIAMCHTCSCLDTCKAWVESQPPNALSGVYGGRLHTHPSDGRYGVQNRTGTGH